MRQPLSLQLENSVVNLIRGLKPLISIHKFDSRLGNQVDIVMFTMLVKGRAEFEEQTREHIYEYAADAGLRILFLLAVRSTKKKYQIVLMNMLMGILKG
ncbi:hypothetical protein V2J09_018044 [Rumex salicifolius]